MVNAANLLLGAVAVPEQTQCPGGFQTAPDQYPLSSPFLAIVQDLLGSEEQQSSDEMRAGQQAVVDEQPEAPDAVETSCLLGSVQPACVEVQALPGETVTEASVSAEMPAVAAQNSNPQVVPNRPQPAEPERSAEAIAPERPSEPLPEPSVGTVTAVRNGAAPVGGSQSAHAGDGEPVRHRTADVERPVRSQPQSADQQVRTANDRSTAEVMTPRTHADRAELPEYLRNIVSREGGRSAGRVITEAEPRIVRPAIEADVELAAAPVESVQASPPATDLPDSESVEVIRTATDVPDTHPGVRWTPIEARPTAERPVAVASSQSVDPVERTSVIHQIVRTAKTHVFDGGGEIAMRLEPAHLGSISMRVTADNGVITAHLRTGNDSVRQVLEAEIVALRQSLADSGIRVDSISVSVGDNLGEGWNWHAGRHNGSQHSGHQQSGYHTARLYRDGIGAATPEQSAAAYTGAGLNYLA